MVLKGTTTIVTRKDIPRGWKAKGGMSEKEQAFVDSFLSHFDPGKAYVEAGYLTALRGSYRENVSKGRSILSRPEVAKEVATRLTAAVMSKEEVLYRLSEQGRNEYAKYILEDLTIDVASMIADGKAHLIKLIRPGRFGAIIEFMDGQRALESLGRYHKLFVDRLETEGSVTVRVVYEDPLPEDESLS